MAGLSSGVSWTSPASCLLDSPTSLTNIFPVGGGPVEIGSGIGGLAYSWVLGRRREKELINFRPHNVSGLVGCFLPLMILYFCPDFLRCSRHIHPLVRVDWLQWRLCIRS
jgi:hypothetical protein